MELTQLVREGFELYRGLNDTHPLMGSITTAMAVFPLADIVSQYITDKRVDWKKVRYTAALSPLYGTGIYGCVQSGDLIKDHVSENPLARAALGPNLWGNVHNAFFFINNTIGEQSGYDLGALVNHYRKTFVSSTPFHNIAETIKKHVPGREYLNAFIGSVTFWNGFQAINYAYIPPELQTPTTLGVAFVWTVALSTWSLRGRRRLSAEFPTSPTPVP